MAAPTDSSAPHDNADRQDDKQHDNKDCREVLEVVYLYLDDELHEGDTAEVSRANIARHLEECGPCLREYGIEEEVKLLVRRCCGGDQAPVAPVSLRESLRIRLRGAGISNN